MFHDTALPNFIGIFAIGSAEFTTSIATSVSGREIRNSDSQIPRRKYEIKNCILSEEQFDIFYSFFKARYGMRFSFRMKDQFDFKAEKQMIAVGDGNRKDFQLKKHIMTIYLPIFVILQNQS